MEIKDRVTAQVADWLYLAHEEKISWETASLLINSFELGLCEASTEAGTPNIHLKAYEVIADANNYIKLQGHKVSYPPCSKNKVAANEVAKKLKSTINFSSRRIMKQVTNS